MSEVPPLSTAEHKITVNASFHRERSPPMPDIEYTAISDAIANAPPPPRAAIWDTTITGPAAHRYSVLSRYIAQAAAEQVQVEVFASPDALQSANLAGKDELNGARIVQGVIQAVAFDQYRFKFCR